MRFPKEEDIVWGLKNKRSWYALSLFLLFVHFYGGLLGGCAVSPVNEIAEAQHSLEQAREVQAQRYASRTLQEAEDALKKAQEYLKQGEKEKSLSWAGESKQKSKKAKEETALVKEKLRKETQISLEETERAILLSEKNQLKPSLEKELELSRETIKRARIALDLKNYDEADDLVLLAKSQAQGLIEAAKRAEEEAAKLAEQNERAQRERKILEALNQGVTSYKVKAGETLWMIAGHAEIYNDPLLWSIIYKANRDQIRDPEVIFTDQILKIPRNITGEQRNIAIKEASEGTWFKHSNIGDKKSALPKEP